MKPRVTKIVLTPSGGSLFCEEGFSVEIDDEGGGEFVVIECHQRDFDRVAINPDEWPSLRDAIDSMVKECSRDLA